MTKETYERNHLIVNLLTVSVSEPHNYHIRGHSCKGGRHGVGAVPENLHLNSQQAAKNVGLVWASETSKP